MNIGEAARASGVSAKMIRHYEATGVQARIRRSYSGYRGYDDADVHRLQFIRRGRNAGFSLEQLKKLMSLWDDRERPAGEVRTLAQQHLRDLEWRIAELQSIAATLGDLIERCPGGDRPDCPILKSLSGDLTEPGSGTAPEPGHGRRKTGRPGRM